MSNKDIISEFKTTYLSLSDGWLPLLMPQSAEYLSSYRRLSSKLHSLRSLGGDSEILSTEIEVAFVTSLRRAI